MSELARPAPQEADFFGDYSPAVTVAAAVILVLAISVIDRLTGYDLQVSILQLVPIAMVTWAVGLTAGLALSGAALALWITIFRGEHHYSTSLYFYWDAIVLLITFVTVVVLVARLRDVLRGHEVALSVLEKLDAPAYVLDVQNGEVVVGNREFRASFAKRSAEELARHPAHESRFKLADGRLALLRILTL
jgi:hypothetical protein